MTLGQFFWWIPGFTTKDLLAIFISTNADFNFERNNFLPLDFLLDRCHRNHLSAAHNSIVRQNLLTQLLTQKIKKGQKVRKTPHFVMKCGVFGGDKRDRTADLLNAMSAIREQNEYKCNI